MTISQLLIIMAMILFISTICLQVRVDKSLHPKETKTITPSSVVKDEIYQEKEKLKEKVNEKETEKVNENENVKPKKVSEVKHRSILKNIEKAVKETKKPKVPKIEEVSKEINKSKIDLENSIEMDILEAITENHNGGPSGIEDLEKINKAKIDLENSIDMDILEAITENHNGGSLGIKNLEIPIEIEETENPQYNNIDVSKINKINIPDDVNDLKILENTLDQDEFEDIIFKITNDRLDSLENSEEEKEFIESTIAFEKEIANLEKGKGKQEYHTDEDLEISYSDILDPAKKKEIVNELVSLEPKTWYEELPSGYSKEIIITEEKFQVKKYSW